MKLQELASHIRKEAEYRIREKMSPVMTLLIPVESSEEVAKALEAHEVFTKLLKRGFYVSNDSLVWGFKEDVPVSVVLTLEETMLLVELKCHRE